MEEEMEGWGEGKGKKVQARILGVELATWPTGMPPVLVSHQHTCRSILPKLTFNEYIKMYFQKYFCVSCNEALADLAVVAAAGEQVPVLGVVLAGHQVEGRAQLQLCLGRVLWGRGGVV